MPERFFNLSLDLLCIADFDGYFRRLNPEWEKTLGFQEKELLSKPYLEFVHPEDREATIAEAAKLKTGVETISFENRYRCKDGSYKWLLWKVAPYVPEGLLYAVARDITDRKQMEEALKQANQALETGVRERSAQLNQALPQLEKEIADRQQAEAALRESEWQLNSIFNSLKDVVWSVSATNFAMLYLNRAAEKLYGRPCQEFFDNSNLWLEVIHSEDRDRVIEGHHQLMQNGSREIQYRIIRSDGEVRWVHDRAWLIYDENNQPIRLYGIAADITERKIAEAALRESQSRLNSILNSLKDVVWSAGIDSPEIFYVNPASQNLYGISDEEFLANRHLWFEIIHPEDRDRASEYYHKIMTEGNGEIEYRIVRPDGELRWVYSRTWLIYDENGKAIRMDGLSSDITDRKIAEDKLRQTTAELKAVFQALPDLYFRMNTDGTILDYMAGKSQNLYLPPDQFLGKLIQSVLPPQVADRFHKGVIELTKTGSLVRYEYTLPLAEGEAWFEARLSPLLENQVIAIVRDITPQKQAEEALRQSETRYRNIAKKEALLNRLASDIRNSLDADTILETTVQEIRRLLQIDRCVFLWYRTQESQIFWDVVKEAKKTDLPSYLGQHPVQVNSLVEKFLNREIILSEDVQNANDLEIREIYAIWGYTAILALPIQMPSGDIGMLSCGDYDKPRQWSQNEIELLQAVADQLAIALYQAELYNQAQNSALLAEQKAQELERTLYQLQRTQTQLIQSEKMSSLGQMVAGVAHEINNPVNFIYGNLDCADRYIQDLLRLVKLYDRHYSAAAPEIEEEKEAIDLDFLGEDLPKLLSSMKMGAERIRSIVLSLRNFSRLDESDMKAVNIHEGIDNTLLILHNRLKNKPNYPVIEVIKEYGKLPLVECYAGQLNQVFMNILNNAIDALQMDNQENEKLPNSPFPIPQIRIRTEVVDKNSIAIRIADNGPGMSETVKNRLFDPFFTTKAVGKGTGLGLSISYQIVTEKHGGELKCISALGEGSEFWIVIPISPKLNNCDSIACGEGILNSRS